jgi:hypothetical protein
VHPYRPEPGKLRPALWLPGVVCVECLGDGKARLSAGPLVGWRVSRGVEDWKREVVLVEKAALDEERRNRLPERRIDETRFAKLHRAALACPLVAFDVDEKADLLKAGLRVYHVGWHRVSSGGYVGVEGGGQPTRGVGGEIYGIPIHSVEGKPPPNVDDDESPRPTVDQILRAISDGAIGEEAVELATDLLDALDAPLERQRTDAQRDQALAHWETWLAELFTRAAPFEDECRSLARAIANAPSDGPVPFYGELERVTQPAMVIGCSDHPEERERLTLPRVELYTVGEVEEFRPGYHLLWTPPPPRKSVLAPALVALAIAGLLIWFLR